MARFPNPVQDFANALVQAQVKRHSADYDPDCRLTRSEVLTDIETAEEAIRRFRGVPMKDRRAFAAWLTLPIR